MIPLASDGTVTFHQDQIIAKELVYCEIMDDGEDEPSVMAASTIS